MKKLIGMFVLLCSLSVGAKADDVMFDFGVIKLNVPLKVVEVTELYDFNNKRGATGIATVLGTIGTSKVTLGGAISLEEGEQYPFLSWNTRLSPKFFDIADNELYFGAAVGHEFDIKENTDTRKREKYCVQASLKFW